MTPILTTKLFIPPPRPAVVRRPRLIERLDEGLQRASRLTLISAPAGFGKTTLLSAWVAGCGRPVAWLSLDAGDGDPARLLAHLVAALQTIAPTIGRGVLAALQSPQLAQPDAILTALLNEAAAMPGEVVLVLDDYHVIDARPVDRLLAFLVEHLPPQLQLVIATREDPPLPLARLRAGGQLTELRAGDLRFTSDEAAALLNEIMRLGLSADDVAALEARTEGWVAGLHMAALALRGAATGQARPDSGDLIRSFTGSHRFVLDYLVEEVLEQQPAQVQSFLLHTSVLDRLCGPLCDAVLQSPDASGQAVLEALEHANLFVVPLDSERRWYRYHHLFAEVLRQRLHRAAASPGAAPDVAELHRRASEWYEGQGLEIEAFHHAAAANDVPRCARLVVGKGMPLQFRGALAPVLGWLASQPPDVLDARPALWVMYASALSMTGQLHAVEPKLQAAEAALRGAGPDDGARNLVGHIAAIRALLAAADNRVEAIIAESQRALEHLHPDNLAVRTATIWKLGIAYQLQGDRVAAGQAYAEAIAVSQASGNVMITMAATGGLGSIQEAENELHRAAETYRRLLQLAGDSALPIGCEAHLGLARICYEWNDLEAAERHARQALELARQLQSSDRHVVGEVLLARLHLARGDLDAAAALLAQADRAARQHRLATRMPEIVAAQVLTLLRQGKTAAAARLAQSHALPISQARVHLARGEASAALTLLAAFRRQVEAQGWEDERLRAMVLQALALHARGTADEAVELLADALALAAPGGFVRTFVDEGAPMARLLAEAAARQVLPDAGATLLAALAPHGDPRAQPTVEALSQRELEVLRLMAQGLSNREIGEQLFLALSTVKGHSRAIFGKLQVQRRTAAVARARELGLL